MSLKTIKSAITRNLINIPGWCTKRKIVVIESDDWGSIRMPSMDVYNSFLEKGYKVDQSNYNRLDSLESNDDLIALYDVLSRYKDKFGNPPTLTANSVVANPNFNKIKKSGFANYYYEHVKDTLQQYPRHDKVFDLWHEGIANKVFYPQFHGREHLNIIRWISALNKNNKDVMYTFNHNTTFSGIEDYNFMEAYDQDSYDEISTHKATIADGLKIFKETFGYSSKSFIAPCYTWSSDLDKTLFDHGVQYFQGSIFQMIPKGGFNNYKKKYHFLGQKNAYGQRYLSRNCIFEPSLIKKNNSVDYTLDSIAIAFRLNKPAIISSHRINYIGYLDESNRTNNLILLNTLLKNIILKWPDVEFMTSDKLGDLIDYDIK